MEYGDVPLAPLLWLDDIINGAEQLDQARQVNQRINFLMKQRGLCLNQEKSVCIIMGSKKQKKCATSELEKQPLMCGAFVTQEKSKDKWLGQILSSAGLADSVLQTVISREGKVRGACLEIALIVNDWRAQNIGGMETALMLWETCCIPSMMHGAGTWVEMNKATEKRLNSLQVWFVRLILQVGQGSALSGLFWDTALLDFGLRIWIEKVMLIMHLRSLDESTLARSTYIEQKEKNWPGLVQETKTICQELKIEDVNETKLNKNSFRSLLVKACHAKNEERIIEGASNVKCSRIKHEKYGRKSYIKNQTIAQCRSWFKTRFGLQDFAGNFSHNQKFSKTNWMCRCEKDIEAEGHIVTGQCDVYGDLRLQFGDLGGGQESSRLLQGRPRQKGHTGGRRGQDVATFNCHSCC